MIDQTGAPHILEVNHNPSFAVPTDLDREIKGSVMLSALCKVFDETPPSSPGPATGDLSLLTWEAVASPPDGDATLLLRELKAAFDDLRLPPPRVARRGGAPQSRTGPATIGKAGRKRLKTGLTNLQDSIGVTDFPKMFGKPGTAVTWERFCDVLVSMVTANGSMAGGADGALEQLRTVLRQIADTK